MHVATRYRLSIASFFPPRVFGFFSLIKSFSPATWYTNETKSGHVNISSRSKITQLRHDSWLIRQTCSCCPCPLSEQRRTWLAPRGMSVCDSHNRIDTGSISKLWRTVFIHRVWQVWRKHSAPIPPLCLLLTHLYLIQVSLLLCYVLKRSTEIFLRIPFVHLS